MKGDGGYVIAPPSIHPDTGEPYEYLLNPEDAGIAMCPEWLLGAIRERPRAISSSVDFSKPIPKGKRNSELTRIAGQLTRMGLDAASTRTTLHTINKNQCEPPLDDDDVNRITLYENAGEGTVVDVEEPSTEDLFRDYILDTANRLC